MRIKLWKLVGMSTIAGLAVGLPAHASLLGSDVTFSGAVVGSSSFLQNVGLFTNTVSSGSEFVVDIDSSTRLYQAVIDFGDSSLVIGLTRDVGLSTNAGYDFIFSGFDANMGSLSILTNTTGSSVAIQDVGLHSFTLRVGNMSTDGISPESISLSIDSTSGSVPEPATLALLVFGLTGIGFSRRKQ